MMDCFHTMAPGDEELLRLALDDEPLVKGAQEHLEQCAICQQKLARYKYTEAFLSSQLYRSQCPSATELNYYCANVLSADECSQIVDHLKICPTCTREVADIRRIFADFEPFPEPLPSPQAVVKRVIASLVTWQPHVALRLRSEDTQSAWPRQYCADELNISLHISRASNGETMLLGLFTSTDPDESVEAFEDIVVELYPVVHGEDNQGDERIDAPLMCTGVDDLGNMAFKAVPAGEYVMIVRLPDTELVVKGLTIEHG